MSLAWYALLVAGLGYILWFGFVGSRASAVFAYVAVWLFFPKATEKIPLLGDLGIPGLPVFTVVEAIAALAVLVRLLVTDRRPPGESALLSALKVTILFSAAVLVSNVLAAIASATGLYPPVEPAPLPGGIRSLNVERTVVLVSVLGSIIWLLGAIRFITKFRQVEFLIMLLGISGIEIGVEALLFYELGFFPQAARFTIPAAAGGRFSGVTAQDYLTAGVIGGMAAFGVMYFAITRRKWWLWGVIPLTLLPLYLSFARSILLGFSVALAFIFWESSRPRVRLVLICGSLILAIWMLVAQPWHNLSQVLGRVLGGGEIRTEFLDTESFQSRLAQYIRGAEILIAAPLGVGSGAVQWYVSSSIPSIIPLPDVESIRFYYDLAVSGLYVTGMHNLYLEFVIQHGVLGVLALLSFLAAIGRNFLQRTRVNGNRPSRVETARRCIYAMFLLLGVHYMFNSNPEAYVIWAMLFFLTAVLRSARPASEGTNARSSRTPTTPGRAS